MTKPYTSDNCRLRAVQDPANTTRAAATTAYTAENLTNALEHEPDLRDALSHAVYQKTQRHQQDQPGRSAERLEPRSAFYAFHTKHERTNPGK